MEQLTKNQALATSQEAVQNQNEQQLRDENAHNDTSVHGVLNPTYQAGLLFNAAQPTIIYTLSLHDALPISDPTTTAVASPSAICPTTCAPRSRARSEEHTSELQSRFEVVCRLLLEK